MKQNKNGLIIATILVLAAAISRVVMFPHNFSPIIGMAVFSGAVIKDKRMAFLLPLLSMFLADVMFEVFNITAGFWGWGQLIGYGILALVTVIAFNLKKINVVNVMGYSIISSLIFFLLSNLSFFIFDNPVYHTYTPDTNGLVQCYIQALPFLRISLVADLVYSAVLFGAFFVARNYIVKKQAIA